MKITQLAPLFLLLLFVACQATRTERHARRGSRNNNDSNNNSNVTITTTTATTKSMEKISYPKKVTSLKKRPTKSPSSTSSIAPTKNSSKKNDTLEATATEGDVTTAFKDLPDDDLEFIKELDKQFKLHGDHIKIKVERETNVNGTKNSKRTIDGELGYGYNDHNGYDYARPKFAFYPYSQQDIPSDAPGYYPPKTSVDIQPSYSYELKPQTSYVHTPQDQHQIDLPSAPGGGGNLGHNNQPAQVHQSAQSHYEDPVIVLRIPGPAKYATHLQALLQQYLEIRAAQYLQILEEAELRKQQQQQQQQEQHHHHHQQQQQHQQQEQYDTGAGAYQPESSPHAAGAVLQAPEEQTSQQQQHDYNAEVAYAHQMAPTPQPVLYPDDIHDVYQSYKGRHQTHHAQQQIQLQQPHGSAPEYYADVQTAYHAPSSGEQQTGAHAAQQAAHEEEPPQQQFYFTHHEQVPEDHIYQQYYLISMSPDGHTYAEPQPQQQPEQHEQLHQHQHQQQQQHQQIYRADSDVQTDEDHVPSISENSPRKTHTKVIFTHKDEQQNDAGMYSLPSIRPYERLAPTSAPHHYHQEYVQQDDYQQQASQQSHAIGASANSGVQDTVAITQRPFNYHAHGSGVSGSAGAAGKGRGRTRKRGAMQAKRNEANNSGTITTNTPKHGGLDRSDDQLQKIRKYVRDNLGARMGKEFQARQVLEVV